MQSMEGFGLLGFGGIATSLGLLVSISDTLHRFNLGVLGDLLMRGDIGL